MIENSWMVAGETIILFFILMWLFYSRWKEDRATIKYWRDACDRCFQENVALKLGNDKSERQAGD